VVRAAYHLYSSSSSSSSSNNNNNNNNIIIIVIYLTANGCRPVAVVIMHYMNMKQESKKFRSGGLHEKHAVATWSLENRLSILF
jgi:hypothetical protein